MYIYIYSVNHGSITVNPLDWTSTEFAFGRDGGVLKNRMLPSKGLCHGSPLHFV